LHHRLKVWRKHGPYLFMPGAQHRCAVLYTRPRAGVRYPENHRAEQNLAQNFWARGAHPRSVSGRQKNGADIIVVHAGHPRTFGNAIVLYILLQFFNGNAREKGVFFIENMKVFT